MSRISSSHRFLKKQDERSMYCFFSLEKGSVLDRRLSSFAAWAFIAPTLWQGTPLAPRRRSGRARRWQTLSLLVFFY
jgi:hypothetical protein